MPYRLVSFLFIFSLTSIAQTVISDDINEKPPTLAEILSDEQKAKLTSGYLDSSTDQDEMLVKMLVLDFAPYVKTLDRDIKTYNYREKKIVGVRGNTSLDIDSEKGLQYVKDWAGAIKKHNAREGGIVGWGFYTADNPRSSAGYSGINNDFLLVSLRYPKKSKMLDLRRLSGDRIPVSQKTLAKLSYLCPSLSAYRDTERNSINKKTLTSDKRCHDLFNKALNKMGINGLIYLWGNNYSRKCKNGNHRASAFVAVNVPIGKENIDTFTNLVDQKSYKTKNPQSVLKSIRSKAKGDFTAEDYKAYQKLHVNFALQGSHPFRQHLEAFKPNETDYKKYEKEILTETFGCRKEFAIQDKPHYDPKQVYEYILKEGFYNLDPVKSVEGKQCKAE